MDEWKQCIAERLREIEVICSLEHKQFKEAIKDHEKRITKTEFSEQYKKGIFAVLLFLAGLAGAIFTKLLQYITINIPTP